MVVPLLSLLYLFCFSAADLDCYGHVEYAWLKPLVKAGSESEWVGVEAGNFPKMNIPFGGSIDLDYGTTCKFVVGVYTPFGGWGCIINGIDEGEEKWCIPDTRFYIVSYRDSQAFGQFVAMKKGCDDDVFVVNRIGMKMSGAINKETWHDVNEAVTGLYVTELNEGRHHPSVKYDSSAVTASGVQPVSIVNTGNYKIKSLEEPKSEPKQEPIASPIYNPYTFAGISCILFLSLLLNIFLICNKRKRNDYNSVTYIDSEYESEKKELNANV